MRRYYTHTNHDTTSCLPSRIASVRCLLLLGQTDTLALEHVEQRLRAFKDLHVCRLCLHYGFVVLIARRHLARQRVVDARKSGVGGDCLARQHVSTWIEYDLHSKNRVARRTNIAITSQLSQARVFVNESTNDTRSL